ncbi:MAG: FKBP-type peptidyl-prolyl cis-trans isomerase SlyD [Planctomycetota bacterium]|jgi:FKBP-type peptidyl-prolyl cis-trans isomerase SlyD
MTEANTIEDGTVVTMHYKLVLGDGQVVDSSEGSEPLAYLHGSGNIVPGLESAMIGKAEGEKFDVAVAPEGGYGVRHDEAVQTVPKTMFPPDAELEAGIQFQATDEEERPIMGTIKEVAEETVTVDFNHPLAGEELNFSIEVVGVRAATEEEKEHGHVHGAGGHQH